MQVGNPILTIEEKRLLSGIRNSFIWQKIMLSFLAKTKKIRVTVACASTVAIAAPATPMTGNGPSPKISTGSNIILIRRPVKVAIKEERLLPAAVNIPVSVWFKKEKMTHPQVIFR